MMPQEECDGFCVSRRKQCVLVEDENDENEDLEPPRGVQSYKKQGACRGEPRSRPLLFGWAKETAPVPCPIILGATANRKSICSQTHRAGALIA